MIEEVLSDLKRLALKGPIKSVASGSNAIGKTLQAELGIQHTTTTRNQYKGFTITSTSLRGANRINLFARVPDWRNSPVSSSKQILDLYGKDDESGKYQRSLFCTVSALELNTIGLKLSVNEREQELTEWHHSEDQKSLVARWNAQQIKTKLIGLDKSVTVSASVQKKSDGQYFHYQLAEFTMRPTYEKFLQQIRFGSITLDHLISMSFGTDVAREQGPLFKISKDAKPDLFEDYKKFDLLD